MAAQQRPDLKPIVWQLLGKCNFCVKAHYETLKKEGYTVEQLRDIGRISAVIAAVSKILSS
jgi:alkyl hydroperoxide reductase subunit D